MERLTYFENGKWYIDGLLPNTTTSGQKIDRIAELENESEQREKGCEYCKNEKPLYYAHREIISREGCFTEPIYIKNTDYDYCPKCGKRLGVKK